MINVIFVLNVTARRRVTVAAAVGQHVSARTVRDQSGDAVERVMQAAAERRRGHRQRR